MATIVTNKLISHFYLPPPAAWIEFDDWILKAVFTSCSLCNATYHWIPAGIRNKRYPATQIFAENRLHSLPSIDISLCVSLALFTFDVSQLLSMLHIHYEMCRSSCSFKQSNASPANEPIEENHCFPLCGLVYVPKWSSVPFKCSRPCLAESSPPALVHSVQCNLIPWIIQSL